MSAHNKYPQVIFDISVGSEPIGRVTFELFTDLTPKTAENFRSLCTGEQGIKNVNGQNKKLHYKGSKFHRIIDGFVVQGGDIINGDGTGSVSIYGDHFADENFTRRHACAGLLSMANAGRNTNGCQFFITLKECPHLDGKHTVFGQVIDGMQVVRKMSKVPIDMNDKPKVPVIITNVDQIGDQLQRFRNDPFSKDNQLIVKKSEYEAQKQQQLQEIDDQKREEHLEQLKKLDEEIKQLKESKDQETKEIQQFKNLQNKLPSSTKSKLQQLQYKINQVKRTNTLAVLQEERQNQDPNYEKNQKIAKYKQKIQEKHKVMEQRGLDKDQFYLNQSAHSAQLQQHKKDMKKTTFGWDIFNVDANYKQYEKNCKNLRFNQDHYNKQKEDGTIGESTDGLQKLSEDMQRQQDARDKKKKRKTFDPDEKVDYINERNRMYNKKLDRAFDPYVQDIKASLEQKTAQQ